MRIVIKIHENGQIIDYDELTEDEKKEVGHRLNEQAMNALGYVRT